MRRWLRLVAVPSLAAGATVIACAGDSITAGGHGRGESYPELLEAALGSGYEVHNFGKSGTTATDARPWRETSGFDGMVEVEYDVGIVMLGTNDAKVDDWKQNAKTYVEDYVGVLEALRDAAPSRAVYFVGIPVPYRCCSSKWGDDVTIINDDLPKLARRIAADFGAEIIDFRKAMGGDEPVSDYYDDKVHPNEKGYRAMALEAAEVRRCRVLLVSRTRRLLGARGRRRRLGRPHRGALVRTDLRADVRAYARAAPETDRRADDLRADDVAALAAADGGAVVARRPSVLRLLETRRSPR